jgi:hypothetical protein
MMHALAEGEAREDRHHGQGKQHRSRQRENDGPRHRPKHPAFRTGQGQDRQVNDDDDADREGHWPADLDRSSTDDVDDGRRTLASSGKAPNDVFDHDDRAVDDQSEVDCAQAHQVAGDAADHHSAESEQHGERDRRRDDQSAAEVAE